MCSQGGIWDENILKETRKEAGTEEIQLCKTLEDLSKSLKGDYRTLLNGNKAPAVIRPREKQEIKKKNEEEEEDEVEKEDKEKDVLVSLGGKLFL
jgi:CO dehydrogenase/acetyl-CoA synthase beta subunit